MRQSEEPRGSIRSGRCAVSKSVPNIYNPPRPEPRVDQHLVALCPLRKTVRVYSGSPYCFPITHKPEVETLPPRSHRSRVGQWPIMRNIVLPSRASYRWRVIRPEHALLLKQNRFSTVGGSGQPFKEPALAQTDPLVPSGIAILGSPARFQYRCINLSEARTSVIAETQLSTLAGA
jgi:hypothetical protein